MASEAGSATSAAGAGAAASSSADGADHPKSRLDAIAAEVGVVLDSVDFAKAMDARDELASFRAKFAVPPTEESAKLRAGRPQSVYLCGNSLGLMPRAVRDYVNEELKKWEDFGVEGHFRTERPWVTVDETVKDASARIVGAKPDEVVIMGTLTANLHFLMVPFYRPDKAAGKYKILVESKSFPSDAYAMQSQVSFHGYEPKDAIVQVYPREGEEILHTSDFLAAIDEHADELALVMVAGVHYYTGQRINIQKIAAKCAEKGIIVGVDLAHAVGNVPLQLHDWGVDFACWCSYKYLNSGPGGIAGIFVHEKHAETDRPRFAGWWGHRKSDRFMMHHDFSPTPGAAGFQLSNPAVLPCAALRASLDLFDEATMARLRAKSLLITAYLEHLVKTKLSDLVSIVTPADPEARGCQLSLTFVPNVKDVYKRLGEESVIVDVREPHAMRVAPAPMYNSYQDVHEFVDVLRHVCDDLFSKGTEA